MFRSSVRAWVCILFGYNKVFSVANSILEYSNETVPYLVNRSYYEIAIHWLTYFGRVLTLQSVQTPNWIGENMLIWTHTHTIVGGLMHQRF